MKGWLFIPVEYKGKQLEFRGKLLKGNGRYGYKIKVKVGGGEVVFEEEVDGEYKLMVTSEFHDTKIDGELVRAIAEVVELAVRQPIYNQECSYL